MSDIQINIQLKRDFEVGGLYVHKIECYHDSVKTVMSFRLPMTLDQVFREEIVDYLHGIIPVNLASSVKVSEGAKFPALAFAWEGVHVVVHQAFAGIQSLTIRIMKAVGNAQQMYLPSEKPGSGLITSLG